MKVSIPLLSSYIISTTFSRIHAFMSSSFPHANFLNEVANDSSSSSSKVKAVWDPIQQIYVGGVVPATNEKVVDEYLTECKQSMHHDNPMTLRIFGYGSLCWSPGTGALAKEGVMTKLGRVMGYKRCWAQRSTDHRGIPSFPGIVCTLLTDEELRILSNAPYTSEEKPSMTEGIIYEIPGELLEECLTELDFREKGGYARDVIEVVEYDTGNIVKALLYRGTPDNPAFWKRALFDLSFAAAVIAAATGPSGRNDEYLFHLDKFMSNPNLSTASCDDCHGDTDTHTLTTMVKYIQQRQM